MSGFMRMHGLVLKEIKQIVRDPSAILIAFLMPVVLLIVNGFGISFDASHMRVAVVIAAPEEEVRGLLQSMAASPYLDPQRLPDTHAAEAALMRGDVRGILVLRDDFSQRLQRNTRWPAAGSAHRQRHRSELRPHPGRLCLRCAGGLAGGSVNGAAHHPRPAPSTWKAAIGSTPNCAPPMRSFPASSPW